MLRILHIINVLLILPMMALGMMAGFSGGGLNPEYQRIGIRLVAVSPAAIVFVIMAEVLWRFDLKPFAYIAALVPLAFWLGMLIWLQIETQFFF